MNYRNIDDLNHCILQHLSILPRDFDLIVGVPRSGMFPRPENGGKLST